MESFDCRNIVFKYNHNLLYSDVMDELKNVSELEVIKYPDCNDYYNTETMHFSLPSGKLSVNIHKWTMMHEVDYPVNSQRILDSIKDRMDNGCPHILAFNYRYRDDKRYLHF